MCTWTKKKPALKSNMLSLPDQSPIYYLIMDALDESPISSWMSSAESGHPYNVQPVQSCLGDAQLYVCKYAMHPGSRGGDVLQIQ